MEKFRIQCALSLWCHKSHEVVRRTETALMEEANSIVHTLYRNCAHWVHNSVVNCMFSLNEALGSVPGTTGRKCHWIWSTGHHPSTDGPWASSWQSSFAEFSFLIPVREGNELPLSVEKSSFFSLQGYYGKGNTTGVSDNRDFATNTVNESSGPSLSFKKQNKRLSRENLRALRPILAGEGIART